MKKLDSAIIAAIITLIGGIIVAVIGIMFGKTIIQVVYPSGITPTSTVIARTTTANNPPTPTPSPTPTPTSSPTPTQITITKNLVIPCISKCAIALKLTTIVIDTTAQTSTWNFTLTNTTDSVQAHFYTLELEDSTGQKHQGAGLAKTDTWVMSSGQTIPTNATFDVAHGTNYSLNISISYNTWYTDTHQTEIVTF